MPRRATLRRGRRPRPGREGKPCPTGVEQLAWNLSGTTLISLAAREVSRRGGGARRGSEAPELMSPQGEIQAERA